MAKILVYQMCAVSFSGFSSMIDYLGRIKRLGATHVYLSALLTSMWYDYGFSVVNHMGIDHRIGTMDDFKQFVTEAHRLSLKVVIDLNLNHTSTKHPWFREHPEYYCRLRDAAPGWHNHYDNTDAWHYDELRGNYYLSSFTKHQADLRWFTPDGEINHNLVERFHKIVEYWVKRYRVDGFRLDCPQWLNKNYTFIEPPKSFRNVLFNDKDERVINAIFPNKDKAPFLMTECYDPTFGDLIEYYTEYTPIQFVMNPMVKDTTNMLDFLRNAHHSEENHHFMLHTEDHSSPRFTPWVDITPVQSLFYLFNSQAQAICICQGQELGLCGSYANVRDPIPLAEYDQQMVQVRSYYNYARYLINRWYHL